MTSEISIPRQLGNQIKSNQEILELAAFTALASPVLLLNRSVRYV
jgi:hypothetical protein